MTTVRPGRTSAGSWKHSDFPPPVGMIARTSRPVQHGTDNLFLTRAEGREAPDRMQEVGGDGHGVLGHGVLRPLFWTGVG